MVLRVTHASALAVQGTTTPGALVRVDNGSAAPYAVADGLERKTRADAHGHFSVTVPAARSGDVVVVRSGGATPITVRLDGGADVRRPECTLQGLRFVAAADGSIRAQSVRENASVSEPFLKLRFKNTRTKVVS